MIKTITDNFPQPQTKDLGIWLILLLPILFYQTTFSFYNRWINHETNTYSHGLIIATGCLIILILDYLRHRNELRLSPSYSALVPFVFSLFIWLLATVSNTTIIYQVAITFIAVSMLCFCYGYRSFIKLYPAFILFLTITPIWSFLNTPLRKLSATLSSDLLNIIGFSNIQSGFYIEIPAGLFIVDIGCSGLSQLVVALTVSVIYSWYVKFTIAKTCLAICLAFLVSIVSNIVRITIIIVFGQLSDMQHYFVTTEHISLGWAVFAVFIFIYFQFCVNFLETEETTKVTETPSIPETRNIRPYILIVLPLLFFSLFNNYITKQNITSKHPLSIATNYTETSYTNDALEPLIPGATIELNKTYIYKSSEITLHVHYFSNQTQNKEAINTEHKIAKDVKNIASIDDFNDQFNTYRVTDNNNFHYLAIQTYWVNGKFFQSRYAAKLMNSLQIIMGKPYIASVIIRSTYGDQKYLKQFVREELKSINQSLLNISKDTD